jgi:large subunit ribosomal protein L18
MRIRIKKRKIIGTPEKPRLSVYRSLRYIYAQIVDDYSGRTLVSASSLKLKQKGGKAVAKQVGLNLASAAKTAGISQVVFDRGDFAYHGRIAALADGAREGGLKF